MTRRHHPRCFGLAATICTLLGPAACGGRSPLEAGELPSAPTAGAAGSAGAANVGGHASSTGGAAQMEPPPPEPLPMQPSCEALTLNVDELRPSVTLLVDQSGSMREGYPTRDSPETRWSLVRQALLDPMSGVVKSLDHSVQFGLTFYTSHNGFSGGACPILSEVRSATGNYESIAALYDSSLPDDDTPTGPAVAQVVKEMLAFNHKGPQVLLLVTDGDADTCNVPDPQLGQADAITAVAAAYTLGIDFYVLGISSDISGDNLQQLANAGKGKRIDAKWGVDPDAAQPFQASSSVAGVTAQLRDILLRVPLCEVELDRDVDAAEVKNGRVSVDGKRLVYGDPDGFQLADSRHLRIVGKGCDALRSSGKRLSVRISCGN